MTIGAIRLNKTEIETQQNSRAVWRFPRRAAARDAPAVWCFLPPGRVEEVPLLVLEPSARTIAAWQRRTNLWRKATSPCQGAKRLRKRTANDGYSDEKMCPMSRKTRIRCPLPQCVERPLVGSCGLLFDSLRGATPVASP